jgi:hypothetical protein
MTLDQRAGLVQACRRLSPIHSDYATLPIQEGFDWYPCLADVHFDRLYLIVFRSVRRATADLELLREYDDKAYDEALEAGGLLHYFRGSMNERRQCLSFCLWESPEQARRASGGTSHRAAAGLAAKMYESYALERYDLLRVGGLKGDLVFRRLEGGLSREAAPGVPAREVQERWRGLST